MAQNISDNIRTAAPKPLDDKWGVFEALPIGWRPFNNIAEFNSIIPLASRFNSQTFWVKSETNSDKADLYTLDKNKTPYKVQADVDLSNYYTKAQIDAFNTSMQLEITSLQEVTTELNEDLIDLTGDVQQLEEDKLDKDEVTTAIRITYNDLEPDKKTFVSEAIGSVAFSLEMNGLGLLRVGIDYNLITSPVRGFVLTNPTFGVNDLIVLTGTFAPPIENEYSDLVAQIDANANGLEILGEDIDNETLARQNADAIITNAINAEVTRAGLAENVLDGKITSETSRAQSVENGLTGSVNALNATVSALGGGTLNASPASTPTAGVFTYNISTAGTYTNFGGVVISSGDLTSGLVQIRQISGVWTKVITPLVLDNYVQSYQAQLKWKLPNSSFTADEKQAIDALQDVVIQTPDKATRYSLNYIRRGNSSVGCQISFALTGTGNSFALSTSVGAVSGIVSYETNSSINAFIQDKIIVTINWDKITNIGNQLIIGDKLKSEFADSVYDFYGTTIRPILNNSTVTLNDNDKIALDSVKDVTVKLKNITPLDYGIRYIQKGSASLATIISLFADTAGSISFATTFAVGVPTGLQTYLCTNLTNKDEISVTIDWSKSKLTDGQRIELSAGKAILSKSRFLYIPEINSALFRYQYPIFSNSEIGALRGILDISVRSKSEIFTPYALRYLRRGSASVATAISLFYNSNEDSAATTFSVGTVSGIQSYLWLNPNNGDVVKIDIDWDRTNILEGAQSDITANRALFSESVFTVITGLEGIRINLFANMAAPFNSADKNLLKGITDVYIKSKSDNFTLYGIRYIQRGSSTLPTIIAIFVGSDAFNINLNIPIGAVSGVVEYKWTNNGTAPDAIGNGDEIILTIDWGKSGMTAGQRIDISYPRAVFSKGIYSAASSGGGGGDVYPETVPLVLPDVLYVAKNIDLPVYSENLREVSGVDEYNTRCDIIGGGNSVPFSKHDNPYRFQFTGTTPANFNITVSNKKYSGGVINSGTIQVKPTSDVFNPTTEHRMLMLGDSNFAIPSDQCLMGRSLYSLITTRGSFVPIFIGTRGIDVGGLTILNEGHSGSRTIDYVNSATLPTGGGGTRPNPFWDGTKFNFSFYMANNPSFGGCNRLMISLGANDQILVAGGSLSVAQFITNLKTIITSAWEYNPDMRISLLSPSLGAMQVDSGNVIKTNTLPLTKAIKTNFSGDIYKSVNNVPVKLCNDYATVDRVHGFDTTANSERAGFGSPAQATVPWRYPFDTTHVNSDAYRGRAAQLFSQILHDLNNP